MGRQVSWWPMDSAAVVVEVAVKSDPSCGSSGRSDGRNPHGRNLGPRLVLLGSSCSAKAGGS